MDQADSLRALMRSARPLAEDFGQCVVAVQSVAPILGKAPLILCLALGLARLGRRVLILDEEGCVAGWGQPPVAQWADKGLTPAQCLRRVTDEIYILPLMGLRDQARDAIEMLEAMFESYSWNPDCVLIAQGGRVKTGFPRLLITDGSREHLDLLRDEFMTGSLRQAAVACVGALDARAARLAFEAFERSAMAFGAGELFYAGFLDLRERSLLHLSCESLSELGRHGPEGTEIPQPLSTMSHWLAKRVLEWRGEVADSGDDFQRFDSDMRKAPIVHRFMEESGEWPARDGEMAPGKWEGFWKALFGEVNA